MATFRRGLDAEDRIVTKLEGFGCSIRRDPRWDHKHKLDFVITNFIDNPNFYSFGVQITTKLDQLEKQEEFLRANSNSRVTNKALYMELGEKLDLEDGGALAVLSVILEFQFNRSYFSTRLSAARVYDDLTYQFYDLAARVKQLRERTDDQHWRAETAVMGQSARVMPISYVRNPSGTDAMAGPAPTPPAAAAPLASSNFIPGLPREMDSPVPAQAAEGRILSYIRQGGHGVIHGEGDARFFFHISHVSDEGLREQLNGLPYSTLATALDLPVSFHNVGYTKPNAKHPEARQVRLTP